MMKIGCFQSLKMGDFICLTPALGLLRQCYPEADISFIGGSALLPLVKRYKLWLDRMHVFPGSPLIPEQQAPRSFATEFAKKMRQERFNILFNFHGVGPQSTTLLNEWHSERLIVQSEADDSPTPMIKRHVRLVQSLICACETNSRPFFPLLNHDYETALTIQRTLRIAPREYVCIHPGASTQAKRWPLDFFAAAAKRLQQVGAKIVITGNDHETDLALTLKRKLGADTHEVASLALDVGGLAALIASSRLLVCNDTGVLHLAAALQVPSVTVFQNHELRTKWHSPYGSRHAAFVAGDFDCVRQVISAALTRWRIPQKTSVTTTELQ